MNLISVLKEFRSHSLISVRFYTHTHTHIYIYTGCFIIYSRITKMYYRKTVGHVFTKPVQIEGTTNFFFSVSCLYRSSHLRRYAIRVYVVRKWSLRGRSRFVCWNITQVSLWLLCNMHFMQSTQRTHLKGSPKVNVFCAISSQKVYGPFFFAEDTITGMTYLDMLQQTYRRSYSIKSEVPPTSAVRFVST